MTWDAITIQAIVRHVLTFVGGILVSTGWLDAGMLEQLTGAIVTIVALIWSVKDKAATTAKVNKLENEVSSKSF